MPHCPLLFGCPISKPAALFLSYLHILTKHDHISRPCHTVLCDFMCPIPRPAALFFHNCKFRPNTTTLPARLCHAVLCDFMCPIPRPAALFSQYPHILAKHDHITRPLVPHCPLRFTCPIPKISSSILSYLHILAKHDHITRPCNTVLRDLCVPSQNQQLRNRPAQHTGVFLTGVQAFVTALHIAHDT